MVRCHLRNCRLGPVGDVGASCNRMRNYISSELVYEANYVAVNNCGCRGDRAHCVAADYLTRVRACVCCIMVWCVSGFSGRAC